MARMMYEYERARREYAAQQRARFGNGRIRAFMAGAAVGGVLAAYVLHALAVKGWLS